jgi:predicted DNA-binding transcriptional regulator YafY
MDVKLPNSFFLKIARRLRLAFHKPFAPKKGVLPLKPSIKKSTSGISTSSRIRRSIRNSAGTKTLLWITYTKTTDGETHSYLVEPYSFRYRRIKVGIRKMLYAYDIADGHIKSFALRNIISSKNMKEKFRPKFKIEIAQTLEDLYG